MARLLEFRFHGQSFKCGIDKVDRSRLYGSVDIETRDREGRRCETATLAADGRTLVPTGGTALGYVSEKGTWIERGGLVPVDKHGARVNAVPSSFDTILELEQPTTPERFLDHAIRSTYLLDIVEGTAPPDLVAALGKGAIYKVDFSYRGGVGVDPAFVLQGADETLWLLVGDDSNVNFIGFQEMTSLADGEREAGDSDDIDFEMM